MEIKEKDNKEFFEVTKKDMVLLIYRMKDRFKKGLPLESYPRFDAQVRAIIDVIDPTGEYKNECETESLFSHLMADIADMQTDIFKLNSELKTTQMDKMDNKLVRFAFGFATAALCIALIAVIK